MRADGYNGNWLYDEKGDPYGPASSEDVSAWNEARNLGHRYITKGHHGFVMKFTVELRADFVAHQ